MWIDIPPSGQIRRAYFVEYEHKITSMSIRSGTAAEEMAGPCCSSWLHCLAAKDVLVAQQRAGAGIVLQKREIRLDCWQKKALSPFNRLLGVTEKIAYVLARSEVAMQ
jgi:hypothetical protein